VNKATACLLALACCGPAVVRAANPGYYLVTLYEDEGQRTLDFRYWAIQQKPGTQPNTWPEIGIGYNVTRRWYTELLLSYISGPGIRFSLADYNWQNDYLLTQGQYPFDLALHTNLKWHNNRSASLEFRVGRI
jgi:hypothetical protein